MATHSESHGNPQIRSKVRADNGKVKKLRLCPRSCTQHRTRSGRLAEKNTFDGKRCNNCGFTLGKDENTIEVKFEKASDL